ncbi:glycosyltransferase [Flagellimonas sp.]|uniref:glycosyltransferase n=1 Tax=Flagellimonas sp. TaxID=2058762 RepID=UPI003B5B3155
MKVVKELPISIFNTLRLLSIPTKKLQQANKATVPVIVSLTSIPSRLKSLHLVIRSLMNQDVAPKKIVLWLNNDLKGHLPKALEKLICERFEIRYSELTCSHRKLIHSIEAYPEDVIITCDDDLMYRRNWLSIFYDEHKKNPKNIIGNHTIHINHDHSGNPLPFKKWKYPKTEEVNPQAITPIGAWGILYPPHSVDEKVLNEKLFLKLAPKADDLWFKAMGLLKGTITIQAGNTPKEPIPIGGTQKVALKKENLGLDKNSVQWNALNEHYNLSNIINS